MRKYLLITALTVLPLSANASIANLYPRNDTSPGYAVSNSGQVMRLPQGYQPTRSSLDVLDSPVTIYETTSVPGAMLPDGTALSDADNVTTTTTTTTTITSDAVLVPAATPVAYTPTPVYAPTRYEVRQTTATISSDSGDISLRQTCDEELNHRSRNKAMNTSTTVMGDCLN
jgi:hypothetical protein